MAAQRFILYLKLSSSKEKVNVNFLLKLAEHLGIEMNLWYGLVLVSNFLWQNFCFMRLVLANKRQ